MTDHYVVVGNPITQSKSPLIQELFAEQTKQDLEYGKVLVERGEFNAFAQDYFQQAQNLGMNITMPFKEDAYHFADSLSEGAKLAEAVNTLIKQKDGSVLGENTDGIGLVSHIKNYLKWQIKDKKILILGAGGAVRGVLFPLLNEQPQTIVVANRTAKKAQQLEEIFSPFGNIESCGFDDLKAISDTFDLIINATSTSLSGEVPPVPSKLFTGETCVYDMVYANEPTAFMQWAEAIGAQKISDGLGMLVGQAAESFYLWRNVRPDVEKTLVTIREKLS